MLSASSIRKGNKVLYSRRNIWITVVEVYKDKVAFESFPDNSELDIQQVEGIPLTTNLLQELQFSYNPKELKWTNKDISLKNNQDGSFEGTIRLNKTKSCLSYLHELQNYHQDFFQLYKKESKELL